MKPNSPVHRELGAVVAAEGWNQPDILAHVPDADTDATEQFVRRWTHMLIAMIAHGGAAQVKQLLIKANATESLEPLWLSARAELGEDPRRIDHPGRSQGLTDARTGQCAGSTTCAT